MRIHEHLLIGGRWRGPAGIETIEVHSPATEEPVGRVPAAVPADVDAAVTAARHALERGPWPRMTPSERGEQLGRLGKVLRGRAAELATLISDEVGSPRHWAMSGQVGTALGVLRVHRDLAGDYPWVQTRRSLMGGDVRIRALPVGVVAAVVPWNAPLFTAMLKLAPALLAGCPVLLKPSPLAPLSAFVLAEAALAAGLPDGMLSVLPADTRTSEYLVGHPGVDKVSFTGSSSVGTRIGELCARDVRRVTLEMGGKSAAVLLDDVELTDEMVRELVDGAMANSGQICIAQTRVLVPRARYAEVTDALGDTVRSLRVGDPADDTTDLGPVISEAARRRIQGSVASALADGARLVAGGGQPDLPVGHYLEPTLLADLDPTAPVARDELFGPVAVVLPYDDEDDAVRIANNTEYGLAGSVWTADPTRGEAFAGRLVAGSVGVNTCAAMDLGSPFGGLRRSGIGREGGLEGIAGYLESQSIVIPPGRH